MLRASKAVSRTRGAEPCLKRGKYWIILENSLRGCLCWQPLLGCARELENTGMRGKLLQQDWFPGPAKTPNSSPSSPSPPLAPVWALSPGAGWQSRSPHPAVTIYAQGKHIQSHSPLKAHIPYSLFSCMKARQELAALIHPAVPAQGNISGMLALAWGSVLLAWGRALSTPSHHL